MASIVGFGSHVPEQILNNVSLAKRLGCTPEWIFEVSGIEERRIARPSQSVVDLAVPAARAAIENSTVSPADLGMVIVSSGSNHRRFPGPAVSLGRELELLTIPCIDVPVASAGTLFALSLASRLVDVHGPILVVGSEKMSPVGLREPLEKNVAILFGDGAGACIVTPNHGPLKIIDYALYSDGAFADDLQLGFDGKLEMNGRSVIMQASRKIPSGISSLLEKHSLPPANVTQFLMHQANQNLIDRVAKGLGVPSSRFYTNIAQYGNTSSASMLIAASEYFQNTTLNAGDKICFAAFGAGYHWGALLAEKV